MRKIQKNAVQVAESLKVDTRVVAGITRGVASTLLALLLLMVITGSSGLSAHEEARIDQDVIAALAKGQHPDVIVRFADQADLDGSLHLSYRDRGRFVHEALQATAARSQQNVWQALRARGRNESNRDFRVLWVSNALFVQSVDEELLELFRSSEEVVAIVADRKIQIPDLPFGTNVNPRGQAVNSIVHTRSPEVWAMGFRGEGMVIGSIDSGVRHTHEALIGQYRGTIGDGIFNHDYSWYDPVLLRPEPRSAGPHGSHTLGTSVGGVPEGQQIGVAPGAQWIACVAATPTGLLPFSALIECGQFMLAPTDTTGQNPNPDLRPVAVNNSWGACERSYNDFYGAVIDAWIAAGIVPVFANGNNTNCGYSAPPGLNTVANPARSGKVLGVGSTGNSDGAYAPHSNWGPTDDPNPGTTPYPDHFGYPDLKPNIAAPGVQIISAGDAQDDQYLIGSGTSMSAPQVTGLVALLWQAAPCLHGDYAATGTLIMSSAAPVPYATNSPSDGPGHIPNQATGWGEIDAVRAVEAGLKHCGPQGTIRGQVYEASTGQPIAGARIRLVGETEYVLLTDDHGAFERRLPSGTYQLHVNAYGYAASSTNVEIETDIVMKLDIPLEFAERHVVHGTATDAETGWPLQARVQISTPGAMESVWANPASGSYSIELYANSDYTLSFSAQEPGYDTVTHTVLDLDGERVLDASLPVNSIACQAPGYSGGGGLFEDFEAGDLPMGWTVMTDRPSGTGWQVGTELGSENFVIPSNSVYAASNDDAHSIDSIARQERLITPLLDFDTGDGASLEYLSAFTGALGQMAAVEVSFDAGATWTLISKPAPAGEPTIPAWNPQHIDLSPYADTPFHIAFRTDDGGFWAGGWAIDDVAIRSGKPCVPPSDSGLVLGRVIDSVSHPDGVNGASLQIAGKVGVVTGENPAPEIGDGYFLLSAQAGQRVLIVTSPFHEEVAVMVDVPLNDVRWLLLDMATLPVNQIFRNGFEAP